MKKDTDKILEMLEKLDRKLDIVVDMLHIGPRAYYRAPQDFVSTKKLDNTRWCDYNERKQN